jgi:predicted O-methyltransferase YrrM
VAHDEAQEDRASADGTRGGAPCAILGAVSERRPTDWDDHDLHAWHVLAPLHGSYLPWSAASMKPSGVVAVLNEVAFAEPALVVECGAGVSTLFVARLLRQRGRGRLVTVEHDAGWADWVGRTLRAEGLDGLASVVHAPLGEDGWYDRAPLEAALGDELVGVVLVDGPPAHAPGSEQARYPALPFFLPRLAPGAAVLLDDLWRPGEQAVRERWEAESDLVFAVPHDRGHVAVGRVGREAPAFAR